MGQNAPSLPRRAAGRCWGSGGPGTAWWLHRQPAVPRASADSSPHSQALSAQPFIIPLQKVKTRGAQQSAAHQDLSRFSTAFNKPGQEAPPHRPLPDICPALAATPTLQAETLVHPDQPLFFNTQGESEACKDDTSQGCCVHMQRSLLHAGTIGQSCWQLPSTAKHSGRGQRACGRSQRPSAASPTQERDPDTKHRLLGAVLPNRHAASQALHNSAVMPAGRH